MGNNGALWVILAVSRIKVNNNERSQISSADVLQLVLSARC
jgi:hypothetical protein